MQTAAEIETLQRGNISPERMCTCSEPSNHSHQKQDAYADLSIIGGLPGPQANSLQDLPQNDRQNQANASKNQENRSCSSEARPRHIKAALAQIDWSWQDDALFDRWQCSKTCKIPKKKKDQ